ncbi:MAG: alpha/beta fold hydrolase [Pseudomonadota bacterium]
MSAPEPRPAAVLVHGIMDRGGIFTALRSSLARASIDSHAPDLTPNHGGAPIERLADQLAHYVAHHIPPKTPLHLVGFSMGAIVSRYYLQRLGGAARASQFLSVCAPHQGTRWAHLGPLVGMRQMAPGSDFLTSLDEDVESLASLAVTCYWTPYDLVIVPATSAQLALADNVRVPSLCHQCILRHHQLHADVCRRIGDLASPRTVYE